MNLLLVGISHKTSPLEVRELFALSADRVPEALGALGAEPEIQEAVILSTCNRVEFILKPYEDQNGMAAFRRFVGSFYGLRYDEHAHAFYVHHDAEVVRHLFRVASGLDSLVVGEPQVLGQVKQAYAQAREADTCGSALELVFQRVFTVAKRVRTETRIAEAPVSVSTAAVEMAEQACGDLRDKTVLVIGAGQMGELAARHLVAKGAATLLLSNRTHAQAETLARELHGLAVHFAALWEGLKRADIVISSTGCPHFIITRNDMERLLPERGGRPLFMVDIAVPRDIDPSVRTLPGCTLVDLDGLDQVAGANLRARLQALEAADAMIAEETSLYQEREKRLQVVPTIVSLRRHLEEIRLAELARWRHRLTSLSPQQEQALEALTQSLINKVLHTPFAELKQAASRPDRSEFLEVVRTIFRLEDEAPTEATRAVN